MTNEIQLVRCVAVTIQDGNIIGTFKFLDNEITFRCFENGEHLWCSDPKGKYRIIGNEPKPVPEDLEKNMKIERVMNIINGSGSVKEKAKEIVSELQYHPPMA